MKTKSNPFALRVAIENLERLINERSTDFSKMCELIAIIKERYRELNISQQQLIESNAALIKTVEELGGPTGSCCVS